MNEKARERINRILKELDDQRKLITDLRSQNQNLMRTVAASNSKKTAESKEEESTPRPTTSEIGVVTEFDYVSMDEFRLLVDKYEKVSTDLKETKTSMEKEITDLQSVVEELSSLVEKHRNEIQSLKASLSYMDEIQFELKKKIETLEVQEESYTIQIDNHKKEIESMGEEIKQKTKQIAELEELNNTLRKEMDHIEENQDDYEHTNELTKQLSYENAELAKKVEELEGLEMKREVVIDQNVKALLDGKNKRLEKLEGELSKLLKETKVQSKDLEDWRSKCRMLQENNNELVEKLANNQRLIGGLKTMVTNLQNQIKNSVKPQASQSMPKKKSPNPPQKNITKPKPVSQKTETDPKKKPVINKILTKNDLSKSKPTEETMKNKEDIPKLKELKEKQEKHEAVASPRPQKTQDPKVNLAAKQPVIASKHSLARLEEKETHLNPQSSKLNLVPSATQCYDEIEDNKFSNSEDNDYQMNADGEEQSNKNSGEESAENNDVDQAVYDFLCKQDSNGQFEKVTMNRSAQTEYFAVIDWIIENEEEIRNNETDFEKIKDAVDILADMIGFNGVEDYARLTEAPMIEDTDQMPGASEREPKDHRAVAHKSQSQKIMFPKKNVRTINSKAVAKHFSKVPLISDQVPDKENLQRPNFVEDYTKIEEKKNFKLASKKVTTRMKIEREEVIQDLNDDQDHVIQKSKLVRNAYNKNETLEVIEYIRVPKELSISKPTLPSNNDNNFTDQEINQMRRIANYSAVTSNTYENELLEREKLYFRIYINIKQRYQYKPEKFLKVFKLTFNKVPDFAARLDENYNPKTFLFNFEEFKSYFTQVLHSHQYCGRYCVHFSRFYKKMGLLSSQKLFLKMNHQYIDRLPNLLIESAITSAGK